MDEAYRQIEWKAVFLIAGMLPLGSALDQTGAAKLIAEGVVALVGPYGPHAVMFGLVALTFLATCFVPTAALIVLMAPIVLNTSANMGLSPYALMMAVAMAASASFTTPISHPANILVMGPGGDPGRHHGGGTDFLAPGSLKGIMFRNQVPNLLMWHEGSPEEIVKMI
jgi:di/tricarboxylate transporter